MRRGRPEIIKACGMDQRRRLLWTGGCPNLLDGPEEALEREVQHGYLPGFYARSDVVLEASSRCKDTEQVSEGVAEQRMDKESRRRERASVLLCFTPHEYAQLVSVLIDVTEPSYSIDQLPSASRHATASYAAFGQDSSSTAGGCWICRCVHEMS